MIFLFYLFAAVLLLLSLRSFRGGISYLNFVRSELEKPVRDHTPFVTVIAPCRGLDPGLAENLRCLVEQNYPDYEIIFVCDDPNDPAVPVIDDVLRRAVHKTQIVIAGRAGGCSQKIENLREAVVHASDKSEAFVFVDSDARPTKHWLRLLVAPLWDSSTGA